MQEKATAAERSMRALSGDVNFAPAAGEQAILQRLRALQQTDDVIVTLAYGERPISIRIVVENEAITLGNFEYETPQISVAVGCQPPEDQPVSQQLRNLAARPH